ncbi:hypothetical protein C9374_009011 [Naegleria lovaniensis]|uniref:Uncharacterized protein n=1 Tax=Naegleria lovaniensis TaxID=51637 RepID=A0AA88GIP2_NAELO|nr:uncharacterized protein C9374_009011 [Naegleria lovaniensis]KAG2377926.1 hypothetical protein C9374_009011 [Naegleria lovaniensis]
MPCFSGYEGWRSVRRRSSNIMTLETNLREWLFRKFIKNQKESPAKKDCQVEPPSDDEFIMLMGIGSDDSSPQFEKLYITFRRNSLMWDTDFLKNDLTKWLNDGISPSTVDECMGEIELDQSLVGRRRRVVLGNVKRLFNKMTRNESRMKRSVRMNENNDDIEKGYCNDRGEKSQLFENFVRNHVIASVFEYVDTQSLIQNCSNVCPEWHQLILYDESASHQIFATRIVNVLKRVARQSDSSNLISLFQLENINQNLSHFKDLYSNMRWIDIYLLCGMFHFEMYQDYFITKFDSLLSGHDNDSDNEEWFNSIFQFNPFQQLTLPKEHVLSRSLSRHSNKLVFVHKSDNAAKNTLYNIIEAHPMFTGVCKLDSSKRGIISLMEAVITQPCVTPLSQYHNFSIDFDEGLKLYLHFLKDVANLFQPFSLLKADKQDIAPVRILAKCLIKMQEKARYFAFEILEKNLLHPTVMFVGDDVLIGLHLLLLDNFYKTGQNLNNLPHIHFTKLLLQRKRTLQNTHQVAMFPPQLQEDFLQFALSQTKNPENTTITSPPFPRAYSAVEFITEHIIELSKMCPIEDISNTKDSFSRWVDEQLISYLQLIKSTNPRVVPSKSQDLLFHFHMLHPHHFVQDCQRLTQNILSHHFNFSKENRK